MHPSVQVSTLTYMNNFFSFSGVDLHPLSCTIVVHTVVFFLGVYHNLYIRFPFL